MKSIKKIGFIIVSLLIAIACFTYYINNAGKRDLLKEETKYTVTARQLMKEFSKNEESATRKYLNQAVELNGTITNASKGELILDAHTICTLQDVEKLLEKGKRINVKGRVVGFDNLLGEIKIDNCFIINEL